MSREKAMSKNESANSNANGPFTVHLASCGNPDFGQIPNKPLHGCEPNHYKNVESLEDAARAVKDFITKNDLGAGNWAGGVVRDKNGKTVARVSYNGRVWQENFRSFIERREAAKNHA